MDPNLQAGTSQPPAGPGGSVPPWSPPACWRHPDRAAGVGCQRCGRPLCTECMHQASVGFQCSQCVGARPQKVISGRALFAPGHPPVTTALVAVNVALYLVGLVVSGLGDRMQLNGGLIGDALTRGGPIGVAEGEWYRLISNGFLHAGLLHVAVNMISLWSLGTLLEPRLGRLRFGLLYASSLLAGSLGALALQPDALHIGASGAIFGLFGAVIAFQLSRGLNPFATSVGPLLVLNLLITFGVPGISIGGHVGGLIGGLVAGMALFGLPRRAASPSVAQAVGLLGVLCTLSFFAALWVASNPVVG